MENHPIPQNVTGFEFKLIGDMTIKQFAYLAAGSILAYLTFILPIHFLIKWPFMIVFILLGIALAFIPVGGRPMDRMIINFIKALFSENQYVFRQTPTPVNVSVVTSTIPKPKEQMVHQTANQFPSTPALAPKLQEPTTPPQPIPEIITPFPLTPGDPKMQAQKLSQEQERITKQLEQAKKGTGIEAQQSVIDLNRRLQQVLLDKARLEAELTNLKREATARAQTVTPGVFEPKVSEHVKVIPQNQGIELGATITPSSPNIVSGVVKDQKGEVLQGIIVEIQDKSGIAQRAFKTSKLGQFASSTPLASGTYRIELEDPLNRFKFEVIELTLTGSGVLPIEIKPIDQRDQLRKELFSQAL